MMNENNQNYNYDNIPKDKFELAQMDEKIYDAKFETKPIGYFKDALIRFRKNKSSVVAFYILMFLIFMALFGPYFNRFSGAETDTYLGYIRPRMPLISKLGIFDGTKVLDKGVVTVEMDDNGTPDDTSDDIKRYMYLGEEIPKRAIVEVISEYDKVYRQGSRVATVPSADIRVDTYLLAFAPKILEMDHNQYSKIKDKDGVVIDVLEENIKFEDGKNYSTYRVKVDYLKYKGYTEETVPDFWFGTNQSGQDLFTLLWLGARVSLLIGVFVAVVNISIGVVYGSISGYYGGIVDLAMQRFIEILIGVPFIVILTLVNLYLGAGILSISIALILTGWIGTSGQVRAQFYRYKGREYVLASRTLGARDARLISRHILPNALGPIVTGTVLIIPYAIFTEAIISYLGLGLREGTSIGILLNEGQNNFLRHPHLVFFPAVFISLLMISFNLFGNGLRDALNPSLRGTD